MDPLETGDRVWIPESRSEGTVLTEVAPRSYQVSASNGVVRRNRHQLRVIPSSATEERDEANIESDSSGCSQTTVADHYVTKSGTVSVPPNRYKPYDK